MSEQASEVTPETLRLALMGTDLDDVAMHYREGEVTDTPFTLRVVE